MTRHTHHLISGLIAISLISSPCFAQQPSSASDARQSDSSAIAPNGTAYVTRILPVPATISPDAQKVLSRIVSDAPVPQTLEQRRTGTDKWQAGAGEASKKIYPANVTSDTIAGVPVRIVTPLNLVADKRDRVLINLHGGGFNSDSGSLTETIPIANLTGIKVIAVLYRLAPEHPFPAGLDDAVAKSNRNLRHLGRRHSHQ
jgi:monoterpene epsilon-lactone hydrolase